MANKKYYVVWKGRTTGVFDSWDDAFESVNGFEGARYKAYSSSREAAEAYRQGIIHEETEDLGRFLRQVSDAVHESSRGASSWRDFPEIDRQAWAVDASCLGNPGIMEYQGIDLATGQRIFRIGPFRRATNNIGEYLAIVHALALMNQMGVRHTIYSDSRIAIGWVRKGNANTKLAPHPDNKPVRDLIMRANHWLATHSFRVPIRKWETGRWGEIPADFGRK